MKRAVVFLFSVFFAAFLLFELPMLGRDSMSWAEVFSGDRDVLNYRIYWEMRFPRTVLAMLSGAGLAVCGMVFQALFRNPLATPYTLGVASGASFGTTVFTLMLATRWEPFFRFFGASGFAFGGALFAMGVVYMLSRSRDASSERMLLAGVAVNFFFASMIMFMQYVSEPAQTFRMLRYTMGSFEITPPDSLPWLSFVVIVGAAIMIATSRSLNIIATGNDRAFALGIDVFRFRTFLFLLCSLIIGAIVAVVGPIGFVGLMVPHLCRLVLGPDHRILAPCTFFFGAIFLASCDTLARCLLPAGEVLPVGIITSLLGGPFFLVILLRK